jgi:hypothetical protein
MSSVSTLERPAIDPLQGANSAVAVSTEQREAAMQSAIASEQTPLAGGERRSGSRETAEIALSPEENGLSTTEFLERRANSTEVPVPESLLMSLETRSATSQAAAIAPLNANVAEPLSTSPSPRPIDRLDTSGSTKSPAELAAAKDYIHAAETVLGREIINKDRTKDFPLSLTSGFAQDVALGLLGLSRANGYVLPRNPGELAEAIGRDYGISVNGSGARIADFPGVPENASTRVKITDGKHYWNQVTFKYINEGTSLTQYQQRELEVIGETQRQVGDYLRPLIGALASPPGAPPIEPPIGGPTPPPVVPAPPAERDPTIPEFIQKIRTNKYSEYGADQVAAIGNYLSSGSGRETTLRELSKVDPQLTADIIYWAGETAGVGAGRAGAAEVIASLKTSFVQNYQKTGDDFTYSPTEGFSEFVKASLQAVQRDIRGELTSTPNEDLRRFAGISRAFNATGDESAQYVFFDQSTKYLATLDGAPQAKGELADYLVASQNIGAAFRVLANNPDRAKVFDRILLEGNSLSLTPNRTALNLPLYDLYSRAADLNSQYGRDTEVKDFLNKTGVFERKKEALERAGSIPTLVKDTISAVNAFVATDAQDFAPKSDTNPEGITQDGRNMIEATLGLAKPASFSDAESKVAGVNFLVRHFDVANSAFAELRADKNNLEGLKNLLQKVVVENTDTSQATEGMNSVLNEFERLAVRWGEGSMNANNDAANKGTGKIVNLLSQLGAAGKDASSAGNAQLQFGADLTIDKFAGVISGTAQSIPFIGGVAKELIDPAVTAAKTSSKTAVTNFLKDKKIENTKDSIKAMMLAIDAALEVQELALANMRNDTGFSISNPVETQFAASNFRDFKTAIQSTVKPFQ